MIFNETEHNQYHYVPYHQCSDNYYGQTSGNSFTEIKIQCSEDPECAMFEEYTSGNEPTGTYRFCTEDATQATYIWGRNIYVKGEYRQASKLRIIYSKNNNF